jgi:hypothetical protein
MSDILLDKQTEKVINKAETIYKEAKEQWQDEFVRDSFITDDEEKLLKLIENKPKIIVKWEKRILKLKEIKGYLKFEADKMYSRLYRDLMKNSELNFTQREIDKQIKGNETFIKILKAIEKCDIIISEVESFLGHLRNIHWDIKNEIEIKKLIYAVST